MKDKTQDSYPARERRLIPRGRSFDTLISNLDALPTGFLQVVKGEHIGRIIILNRSMTRLGLSGKFCAVIANRGEQGYFLTPLEGKTFPLVNGEPTGDATVQLCDGTIIEIDGIEMKFHQGNSSAADIAI